MEVIYIQLNIILFSQIKVKHLEEVFLIDYLIKIKGQHKMVACPVCLVIGEHRNVVKISKNQKNENGELTEFCKTLTSQWRLEQMWSELFDFQGITPHIKAIKIFNNMVVTDIKKEEMCEINKWGYQLKAVERECRQLASEYFKLRLNTHVMSS